MSEKTWNEVIQDLIAELEPEEDPPIEGTQTLSLDENQILEVAKYAGVVPKNTEIVNKYFSNKKFVVVYKHKV